MGTSCVVSIHHWNAVMLLPQQQQVPSPGSAGVRDCYLLSLPFLWLRTSGKTPAAMTDKLPATVYRDFVKKEAEHE